MISKSSGSSKQLPKKICTFANTILNGCFCQLEEYPTKPAKSAFIRTLNWPARRAYRIVLIARRLTILNLPMPMDKDRKYTFNASEALDKSRVDFGFYEVYGENDQKLFVPTSVSEVGVYVDAAQPDGELKKATLYHLTAKCWNKASGDFTLDYIISKKEYLEFLNTHKRDEVRLNLFLKYSKKDLQVRKARKSKHIDVRMTDDLYEQICKDAAACNLDPSVYLRELAKKSRPRKSLSEEESSVMQDFVAVYHNYDNFFNATKGVMKGLTPQQKLEYMIEGNTYRTWRKFLLEGLPIMKRMIDGQRMYSNSVWKDAQGKQLPKYDREVIALVPHGDEGYKVVFAHRPNPKGWTGRNVDTGEVTHYTPQLYDVGGWNQPKVKYWLDVNIPKQEKQED